MTANDFGKHVSRKAPSAALGQHQDFPDGDDAVLPQVKPAQSAVHEEQFPPVGRLAECCENHVCSPVPFCPSSQDAQPRAHAGHARGRGGGVEGRGWRVGKRRVGQSSR